ncbi:hypothetical protein IE81DRAFT_9716 [Ceraceosorus guamensis]|uniref:Uncharacterized protein n=1 Tax=Ceraceosorus guamensis TaxID=1522189 RepID=A0A316W473_9BASI|nr:hypothetical protein IE81DRAFT_9716 [Ceraceosorus guamensis]PWN44529.1 hypothetical protein IE81DRAFT_9716 [Ceraceosorus guamensis]
MGILYNASSDVPLPSASKRSYAPGARNGGGMHALDGATRNLSTSDESEDEISTVPRKRLRAMVAGLSKKDRARLKSAGKPPARPAVSSALGWAGAGADMLERKRKEEERRRTREEKRRVREADTQIGGREWRADAVQDEIAVAEARDTGSLTATVQQAVNRALVAPLCTEAKELPDMKALHDAMTLAAVKSGVGGGAAPRAAALLLTALHGHLQNVASGLIGAVRSDRAGGIRTSGHAPAAATARVHAQDGVEAASITHQSAQSARGASDGRKATSNTNAGSNTARAPSAYGSYLAPPSPRLPLRNMPSNLSSRTASTALAASSAADNSAVSFVSTAPTSHAADGRSEPEDDDDMEVDEDRLGSADMVRKYSNTSSGSAKSVENALTVAHPSNLRLRDLAFMLQLTPQVSVETLGQGAAARLLNADALDVSHDDHDDSGIAWTNAGLARLPAEEGYDELMSDALRQAATSKLSDSRVLYGSGAGSKSPRAKYVVDSSSTYRLFHRPDVVENHATRPGSKRSKGSHFAAQQASWQDEKRDEDSNVPRRSSTVSGADRQVSTSAGGASGDDARRRMTDPMFDVVDAVRLLGPFAD